MDIAYVAQTESCALLLDAGGFCRFVVPNPGVSEKLVASAQRCLNAQFVASLDREVEGLLSPEPRVGASLLFTSINEEGRSTLVRFGPLVSFETMEDASAAPQTIREEAKPTKDAVADGLDLGADDEEDDLVFALDEDDAEEEDEGVETSAEPMPDLRDDDSSADVTDLYRTSTGAILNDDVDTDDLLDDESGPQPLQPFPRDADSDIDIVTGSFMRPSRPVLSEITELLQEDGRTARASGFVIRQAALMKPAEEILDDDEPLSKRSSQAARDALEALEALAALNGRETRQRLPTPLSSPTPRPSDEVLLRAVAGIVEDEIAEADDGETRRFIRGPQELPLTKKQLLPPPMPRIERQRPLLRKIR